jgi:hypothetical protein
MPASRSTIEVSASNDGGVFSVVLLGQRLTRSEATALAQRLVALLDLQAAPGTEAAVGAPPKFTAGLARNRLDRFLRATSERSPEPEPRRTPASAAVAHIDADDTGDVSDARVAPPAEPAIPAVPLPERRAPHPDRASAYVHERAEEWWKKSSEPGLAPGVRAEARAIAAELFEIAVELGRQA